MVHMVLVHGRSQEYKIPETEQRELSEATRWGLERVGASHLRSVPISFAYYGDLYQRTVPEHVEERGGAAVSHSELQVSLITDLLRESGAGDADDQERVSFRDLTRLVAALDRHFGVGATFIRHCMEDVAAYLDEETLRQQTITRVVNEVQSSGDNVLLIAHSLGSIVAYDALIQYPELPVQALVTFGSPLGLATVRRRLAERLDLTFPAKLPRWVNVFNREDFVCAEPIFKPFYPASDSRSVEDVEATGKEPSLLNLNAAHDIKVYLSSLSMGTELARLIDASDTDGSEGYQSPPGSIQYMPHTADDVVDRDMLPRPGSYEGSSQSGTPAGSPRSKRASSGSPIWKESVDDPLVHELERRDHSAAHGYPARDSTERPLTDKPLRAIERTVSADFPPAVEPTSENLLHYAIARESIFQVATGIITLGIGSEVHHADLVVSVQARGFDILDSTTGKTQNFHRVTLNGPSGKSPVVSGEA